MMTTAGPLLPRRDVMHHQDRRQQWPNANDDRVAVPPLPPPPHDYLEDSRLPTAEDFKKKRKLVSSCENVPSSAVTTTTTTTTTTTAASRRSSIVDYLFQRATAHVPRPTTTAIPPISIPWCIPSNLYFHPLRLQSPNATTTQILNIRFGASTNDTTTTTATTATTGGQIAICYRSVSSSSSSSSCHCQVAIYQWDTILQATIVGRQKMIRDIILMMTTTPETTSIPDDHTSLHRLITTIPPDLCFPIVLPSSSSNNHHHHTANTHHDRLVVFEYASTYDAVSQQQLHLIVGFHRHNSLLVYHVSAMLLDQHHHHHHHHHHHPRTDRQSGGSDHPFNHCAQQLCTHGTGVPATIDAQSKLIVVTNHGGSHNHHHNNNMTIVLLTRRWIMGWKYPPKRPSSSGPRQCDTNNNNNMMMIPYHWQFQYGTDAFTTITQLPNQHHIHHHVNSNDTVPLDDPTAAARAATLLVVGTSGGIFIVLNMDQLQYPSMSCTLSPTIVHVWTSFRNTTSNRIGDWLNYEQRHYQQRSNHNVHTNGGSQGLGIRALTILPEMYVPSARQPANDYKVRYRFVWITMNGWILSTHIEVSTTTSLSNVSTLGGSTTTTIHVRRKSKAPYFDGICHVHYAVKPIVYRNSTDHSVLIHPPQPTWNYFEHHDEATSSFSVSVSSHGILWYNPLDQDKYTSPQPLPQLPNPDVRVLSSNTSIHIVGRTAAVSSTITGHDSTAPQTPSSRRQHSMVPKLNYIGYDQIRRQSLKSRCTYNDDGNHEIAISRIRARKPTTPHNQHPTCLWMHPDRPLEHILVGTPDCGLYLIESKNKIQVPRPKRSIAENM